MAIIAENIHGWFVCCKTYFSKIYELCLDDKSSARKLKLRDVFFEIKTPFFTNSKSEKYGQIERLNEIPKIKKRKKKNISKNQLDDSKSIAFISETIKELIDVVKHLKYLEDSVITPTEWFENNGKARKAGMEILNCTDTYFAEYSEFFHENSSSSPALKVFGEDEYVLPPHSTFHLCDISSFLKTTEEKYDLIIIDPPWVNRSVKRKKSYSSLKYEHLRSIPFEKLANPGCLIVVWITNSSSAASFVTSDLFPKCNVFLTSMWHWCKITRKGDFVYPLDSHHKKPYENILLGRVQYNGDLSVRPAKEIDAKKVIVSVPSSIHSSKPPLVEVLKPYVKEDAKCLELFARNLLPGWKSVGNEVLKLQNIKLFEEVTT